MPELPEPIRVEARQFASVLDRELTTLRRSRSIWALAIGFVGLVIAAAILTDARGYVPLALGLRTPLELFVPVFAAALGYRSVLADREREELTTFRTYPLRPRTYVLGVYVGRLLVIVPVVVGTLLVAWIVVPLSNSSAVGLATHGGLDSPVYYLRFVSLTAAFAAVVLAVMVGLSAVVRSARRGVVIGVLAVTLVAIGFDLALVLGLAGGVVPVAGLELFVVLSPASAYRGLVLAYVVAPASTAEASLFVTVGGALSLLAWLLGALWIAGWVAWRPSAHAGV